MCIRFRTKQDTGPVAYLRFDHLANIVLQGDLHSGQFCSNCIIQLTGHWLETLGDC